MGRHLGGTHLQQHVVHPWRCEPLGGLPLPVRADGPTGSEGPLTLGCLHTTCVIRGSKVFGGRTPVQPSHSCSRFVHIGWPVPLLPHDARLSSARNPSARNPEPHPRCKRLYAGLLSSPDHPSPVPAPQGDIRFVGSGLSSLPPSTLVAADLGLAEVALLSAFVAAPGQWGGGGTVELHVRNQLVRDALVATGWLRRSCGDCRARRRNDALSVMYQPRLLKLSVAAWPAGRHHAARWSCAVCFSDV